MCGIFGFITNDGSGPDIDRLRRIALVTQTRGNHAFGLAWLDDGGRIQTFKAPGPARMHLDELERCRDAVALIGHCRLATHGTWQDNRNNHPHVAGKGVFVHNGVIFNHALLAHKHRLRTQTQCDTEVLGLLMANRVGGSIAQRAAWAASQAFGDLAFLGLWRNPTRLLVARRGKPLSFGQARDGGLYLASLPESLPGDVKTFVDHVVTVLLHKDNATILGSQVLRLPTDDNLGGGLDDGLGGEP